MNIDIIKVGYLKCNCYLLDIDNKVLVIDPGDDFNRIVSKIGKREVVGIIITHHHKDHDGVLNEMINKFKVPVSDRYNLIEGINTIDNFCFECIYTPGHKEDSITIYFNKDKIMFCGDFIFKDCIGRCDLAGGNISDMKESINKIKKYDIDTILYPGHGVKTSLLYEINNNIYFNEYYYKRINRNGA